MNTAVALLAMVCLTGFAQAAPNLASVREKVAAMKRGGGDGDSDRDWPFAWMEFATLIGRCESAYQFFTMIDYFPEEGVLVKACPHVMKCAQDMEGASEQELKKAEAEIRKYFPLMQCVNLQAERETIAFLRPLNGETDNPFEEGAAPLFGVCMKVFDTVAKESQEMANDADVIDQTLDGAKRSNLNAALRQLINYAKKN